VPLYAGPKSHVLHGQGAIGWLWRCPKSRGVCWAAGTKKKTNNILAGRRSFQSELVLVRVTRGVAHHSSTFQSSAQSHVVLSCYAHSKIVQSRIRIGITDRIFRGGSTCVVIAIVCSLDSSLIAAAFAPHDQATSRLTGSCPPFSENVTHIDHRSQRHERTSVSSELPGTYCALTPIKSPLPPLTVVPKKFKKRERIERTNNHLSRRCAALCLYLLRRIATVVFAVQVVPSVLPSRTALAGTIKNIVKKRPSKAPTRARESS
jgi:hypothetical protein